MASLSLQLQLIEKIKLKLIKVRHTGKRAERCAVQCAAESMQICSFFIFSSKDNSETFQTEKLMISEV